MLFYPLLGIVCFHIMSCVWSNVFWHDQLIMKIVTLPHFQESSITDEVEAELRPASNNSSHTPILPSKKIRPPRDDSLPSPRGVNMPGILRHHDMSASTDLLSPGSSVSPSPQAILSSRSTLVQLRRGAEGGGRAKVGKQAPTPPKRTRCVICDYNNNWCLLTLKV